MGADTSGDAAGTSANGMNGRRREQVVETALSPWILELILRFTLLDGAMKFDPAALARRPHSLPAP